MKLIVYSINFTHFGDARNLTKVREKMRAVFFVECKSQLSHDFGKILFNKRDLKGRPP